MFSTLICAAVTAQSPLKGQALVDDVSRRAFNYFWEQSPAPNYFTLDRAPNYPGKLPHEKTPASIAAIGYALSAYAIGSHRGWVPKRRALDRTIKTMERVLDKAPSHRGWFYHWFDPVTGERMWDCEVSTIDTSIFLNSLVMAEGYFKSPKLTALANKVYERIDWKFMLTDDGAKPDSLFFTMGWRPETKFIGARWDDFNELMHLYLIAYTLWPDMPKASWDKWKRNERIYKGIEFLRGGPLFLHQMANGWWDFKGRRDRLGYDYWVDSRNATLAQIAYCNDNPKGWKGYGGDIWGLSASDFPGGYTASGAPVDVNDVGTLAPVAATASMPFTPAESIRATEAFVHQYPKSYGTYGFTTGMDIGKDWYSKDIIAIDIGQAILNIEVARDEAPYKWMLSQKRVQKAYEIAGLKLTNEGPIEMRPLHRAP